MSLPLSEVEYSVVDYLADGALSLAWLVHTLNEGKRPWDTGAVITALIRLTEKQVIRYCRIPGGPCYQNPTPDQIHALVVAAGQAGSEHVWIELTEQGQHFWDSWQQTR